MAFPTTSVLDNFNRTNASTLGASWTQAGFADQRLQVVSNACAPSSGTNKSNADYYNVATYGPDVEVFVTIPTLAGQSNTSYGVWGRQTAGGNGYYAEWVEGGGVDVYKLSSWGFTQLGATLTGTFAAGDKLGITITGTTTTTITVYKYTGGAWSSLGTRTDSSSPYTAAGYIGAHLYVSSAGGSPTFDDFAGGTVSADAAVSSADTGSGADATSALAAAIAAADTGTDSETGTTGTPIASAETGSGAEATSSLTAALAHADTASGTEDSTLDTGSTTAISSDDAGAGYEATAQTATPGMEDAASGTESSTLAVALAHADTASGTDAEDTSGRTVTSAETASVTDAFAALTFSATDAATAVEGWAISVSLVGTDVAYFVDAAVSLETPEAPYSADSGTVVEEAGVVVMSGPSYYDTVTYRVTFTRSFTGATYITRAVSMEVEL
jgi:hypothetical protein